MMVFRGVQSSGSTKAKSFDEEEVHDVELFLKYWNASREAALHDLRHGVEVQNGFVVIMKQSRRGVITPLHRLGAEPPAPLG